MKNLQTMLSDAGRLFRTVRYLRAGQVADRIARRMYSRVSFEGPPPRLRQPATQWLSCGGRKAALISAEQFRFMALEADICRPDIWNDGSLPKLFLYHLHYFDDLTAAGADDRVELHGRLIDRWIEENPPTGGNGWEPYPLSRRIVNWICWTLSGRALSERAVSSLAMQVRVLLGTLEYHLLGNHLFANAKALVFAGAFFEGPEAETWLRRGLAILDRQIPEQILPDGGHFELSPMYHSVILEDMVDLVQLANVFPKELKDACAKQRWLEKSASMRIWLDTMVHPDGDIAFFNDAAFTQARPPEAIRAYAAMFGIEGEKAAEPLLHLAASGYIRLESGPWCVFFDAAQVGPTYIPGHAHADTLSIELSLNGARLVTNGGTSTYEPGALREIERATASHATVEIDGENSSEVWASFRVGRRARPISVSTSAAPDNLHAVAAHDGYRFMPGKPVHTRSLTLCNERLVIRDSVTGAGSHRILGRFPLHPSVGDVTLAGNEWRIETAKGETVAIRMVGPVECAIERGSFASELGVRQERPVLVWRTVAALPVEIITELRVERCPSPSRGSGS